MVENHFFHLQLYLRFLFFFSLLKTSKCSMSYSHINSSMRLKYVRTHKFCCFNSTGRKDVPAETNTVSLLAC